MVIYLFIHKTDLIKRNRFEIRHRVIECGAFLNVVVFVFGINKAAHVVVDGDIVYFTVKKDINDTNYKFQKVVKEFEDNVAVIKLSSKDTNLEAGEYLYDIQLSLKDGRVDTVVSPTLFEVVDGVTND